MAWVGVGRALYRAVVAADLEGIVTKHLADAYHPKLARWHKILKIQRTGRAEWFLECRGRPKMRFQVSRRPSPVEHRVGSTK